MMTGTVVMMVPVFLMSFLTYTLRFIVWVDKTVGHRVAERKKYARHEAKAQRKRQNEGYRQLSYC